MSEVIDFPGSAENRAQNVIASADSIESLCDALDELGSIKGSGGHVYSADELIGLITRVSAGELEANYITRTSGLRDKVIQLLETDSDTEVPGVVNADTVPELTYFERVSKEPLVRTLLGGYFAAENIDHVRRQDGSDYLFTPEQLQSFLDKYPNEVRLREFIEDYKRAMQRALEHEEDPVAKAHIRDTVLKSLVNISEEQTNAAVTVLYR